MQRVLEVLDYDPSWLDEFEREVPFLENAFMHVFLRAHHIGSTSVPGLPAKPTIDIALEVLKGTVIPEYYPQMENLGYVCRGECLDAPIPGVPGRFYFVKYEGPKHLVHVHAYEEGHEDLREKLALRDYLRSNAKASERYAALKKRLVEDFATDNLAYMRGKDQLVRELIEEATEWLDGDR
jgi:GrpB-like predicted nucleotidyltransferase (UPF0157 family)